GREPRHGHAELVQGAQAGRVRDRLLADVRLGALQDEGRPLRPLGRRLRPLDEGGGGRRPTPVRPRGQGTDVGLGVAAVMAETKTRLLTAGPDFHAEQHIHAEPTSFIRRYVFSMDHKVIAKQFLWYGLAFLALGGTMAMMIRWQIGHPGTPFPVLGELLWPES